MSVFNDLESLDRLLKPFDNLEDQVLRIRSEEWTRALGKLLTDISDNTFAGIPILKIGVIAEDSDAQFRGQEH